jgi:hypothetical protein
MWMMRRATQVLSGTACLLFRSCAWGPPPRALARFARRPDGLAATKTSQAVTAMSAAASHASPGAASGDVPRATKAALKDERRTSKESLTDVLADIGRSFKDLVAITEVSGCQRGFPDEFEDLLLESVRQLPRKQILVSPHSHHRRVDGIIRAQSRAGNARENGNVIAESAISPQIKLARNAASSYPTYLTYPTH